MIFSVFGSALNRVQELMSFSTILTAQKNHLIQVVAAAVAFCPQRSVLKKPCIGAHMPS